MSMGLKTNSTKQKKPEKSPKRTVHKSLSRLEKEK